MKQPSLSDRVVKVRAYRSNEMFRLDIPVKGFDHWRAVELCAATDGKPALLLIFDSAEQRDAELAARASAEGKR